MVQKMLKNLEKKGSLSKDQSSKISSPKKKRLKKLN
jgi:hypothetical protein